MQVVGKILIILGILAVIVGVVMQMGWAPRLLGWMGNLPGDIRIDNGNSRFCFPIVTCIILSVLLTVIVRLVMLFKGE